MEKYREKHLSAEQIAVCADAINEGAYRELGVDIREHIHHCDTCAEEVINVAEISSATQDLNLPSDFRNDTLQNKAKNKSRTRNLFIGLSAAAAIILLAVALFTTPWISLTHHHEIVKPDILPEEEHEHDELAETEKKHDDFKKEAEIVEDDTFEIEEKDEVIKYDQLAAFEPDPTLERLYENMQGAYRGQTTEVLSPPELHYVEDAKLKWKNPSQNTLYLEIFNNKGEEIYSTTTQSESYQIPPLNEGLYYWKLISEDFELLFVGKIISKPIN